MTINSIKNIINQNTRFLGERIKIGFIFINDEGNHYDKNFIDSAIEVCGKLGVEYIFKKNVPEDEECYVAAKELAEQGCKGIFADSFGHESYLLQVAKEYPNIQFAHATGTLAHTVKLNNFHNAFSSIYEARYVTGIAAGMKLKEMIDNGKIKKSEAIIGYVGAFHLPEVISGYTSFFLGIRSIVNSAKMKVRYTNTWYQKETEAETANTLIKTDGCKLISLHADSLSVPKICEIKGIINVSYNNENKELKNTYLISSRINWRVYFNYFINSTINNESMDYDWVGNFSDGSIEVYNVSCIAALGTQEALNQAINDLKENKYKVFNTSKFTVNNKTLTSYKANVDTDENNEKETEVISDGYFHESEYRSAPYFDILIDGIEIPGINFNLMNANVTNIAHQINQKYLFLILFGFIL